MALLEAGAIGDRLIQGSFEQTTISQTRKAILNDIGRLVTESPQALLTIVRDDGLVTKPVHTLLNGLLQHRIVVDDQGLRRGRFTGLIHHGLLLT